VVTVAFLACWLEARLPPFGERRGAFRKKGPFERGRNTIADLEREAEAGFVWI
jgi:hypothetical protein